MAILSFSLKEMNYFIQQGCITLIKRDSECIYCIMLHQIYLIKNAILLNFLFIKKS